VDHPIRGRKKRSRAWAAGLAALAVTLVVTTLGVRRTLGRSGPTIERSEVWTGRVEHRAMVRDVQGRGTLVPERVQWVTATSPARVARILVVAGASVDSDTVIAELQNGELELAALDAERATAAAEAELVELDVAYRTQLLTQESLLATLRSDRSELVRRASTAEALSKRGLIAELDRQQLADQSAGLIARLAHEEKRRDVIGHGLQRRIRSQRAQLDKLREVAAFRRRELGALEVRAGVSGTLQELPLSPGQWVTPGTLIAKVAEPHRLEAEAFIPEAVARDVRAGQSAVLDVQGTSCRGRVAHVDPTVQGGTVRVVVKLDGDPPEGARADTSVTASIEIETIEDALVVHRPAGALPHSSMSLFRVDSDGGGAERVQVQLGRASVREMEILGGVSADAELILSDMTRYEDAPRVWLE
jgi:HlyD family secretion protein